ncbi:hypothetical protein I7I48_01076 [Histoplasma ohiense]|nr:hypothetical protein I7I48_01076 [Histoplasma ohiense (nom. inval.)]
MVLRVLTGCGRSPRSTLLKSQRQGITGLQSMAKKSLREPRTGLIHEEILAVLPHRVELR